MTWQLCNLFFRTAKWTHSAPRDDVYVSVALSTASSRPSSFWAWFVRLVDPRVDSYRESASSRIAVVWWHGGWLPAADCRDMVLGFGISNATRAGVLMTSK